MDTIAIVEHHALVIIIILMIIICALLFMRLMNRILYFERRWREEYKDRFLDWYWQQKKKIALRRINTNKHKLQRLSDVESDPTPEMLALVDKITKDVEFVKSYNVEEPTEMELANPISEEDITLSTLIFNKIDEMIMLEAQHILFPLAATGHNIDVRNYGDHVKAVAEAVQGGLNLGVYKSPIVFKPEYINSYIVKRSAIVVLTTMTELNKQLPPPE